MQFLEPDRKVIAKLCALVSYLILPMGLESSIFSTVAVVQRKTSEICHFSVGMMDYGS